MSIYFVVAITFSTSVRTILLVYFMIIAENKVFLHNSQLILISFARKTECTCIFYLSHLLVHFPNAWIMCLKQLWHNAVSLSYQVVSQQLPQMATPIKVL